VLTVLAGSSTPSGITPAQIRTAYGINNIQFGSVPGDGTGQTIAIVVPYGDPSIFEDVDGFDKQFGGTTTGPTLYDQYGPAKNFLTVLNQSGQPTPPPSPNSTRLEEAMDVEWAHAIAPAAKILVVEANSNSASDLLAAVDVADGNNSAAASLTKNVSVVSMSFGGNEPEKPTSIDSHYTTPVGHQGVTFLAAIPETGSPGNYPASSRNVVAVGGTSLTVDTNNQYQGESEWNDNLGGTSANEKEPVFQLGVQNTGMRQFPDVASDATNVAVYDSYLGNTTPWATRFTGGTSFATPVWAGLIAIANQGRTAAGGQTLDGPSQTLPALYAAPKSDFHVLATGPSQYDTSTGLGSPVADLLVPYLANYKPAAPAPAPSPNPTPTAPPVTPPPSNPPPHASNPIDQIIAEIQQIVAGIEAEIQQLLAAEMAIFSSLFGKTPNA
jgi:subtilase family serine protease